MITLNGKQYTRRELEQHVGHISQIAGVRMMKLQDGPEAGVRVAEVPGERLRLGGMGRVGHVAGEANAGEAPRRPVACHERLGAQRREAVDQSLRSCHRRPITPIRWCRVASR